MKLRVAGFSCVKAIASTCNYRTTFIFMVNHRLKTKGSTKWKYIKPTIVVEYSWVSARCDLSGLSAWPDLWFLRLLKSSDTCSQAELWHSCSSSSLEPLQWTQPGPSRWSTYLAHKSNNSATAGETAPSCQPGNPCTTPPETWDCIIFCLTSEKLIVNMLLE